MGSMPGQRSLDQHQYYAHPRNAFWWIMSQLLGFSLEQDYPMKLEHLTRSGIALWDVLAECERAGSLDSSIVTATELANPLGDVLSKYPSIRAFVFNGQKAHKSFIKHHSNLVEAIPQHVMPSTSPAHASLTREQKLEDWKLLLSLGVRPL